MHNFLQSMEIGKQGEDHVLYYLHNRGKAKHIIDVRNIRTYQVIDVDFLVTFEDDKQYKVEVKTDTYKSGNIYWESISSEESGSDGCFEKTEADYLFYYYINWKRLYIFEMDKYREWFKEQESDFKKLGYQKTVKNKRRGNGHYTSTGYAFPVSILEELNPNWMRRVDMVDIIDKMISESFLEEG